MKLTVLALCAMGSGSFDTGATGGVTAFAGSSPDPFTFNMSSALQVAQSFGTR